VNRAVAPALALLAACFAPEPPPGAPCASGQQCPASLACISGICQRPGPQPDGPGTSSDGPVTPLQCPAGFQRMSSGACLFDSSFESLKWQEAELACEQRGAHLAVPSSLAEAVELQVPRWLGISDRILAGTFRTVTGTVALFTHWDFGEPSGNQLHCVHTGSSDASWHTGPCDFPFPYVCEYDGLAVARDAF
jgi:hypothetical protein